jgi:biofilm PGA synthesis protein PgaD
MPEIIIEDKPELRGKTRTTVEWTITTLMWAFWIYLFLPMATVVLWVAGLHFIYHSVVEPAVLTHVKEMLMRLGLFIAIVFVALRGWGYYNFYVFGRLNRRKHSAPITPADMAGHFGLSEDRVRMLQNEKEIVLFNGEEEVGEVDAAANLESVLEIRDTEPVVRGSSIR